MDSIQAKNQETLAKLALEMEALKALESESTKKQEISRCKKVNQVHQCMEALLQEFEKDGIDVITEVETAHGSLDFFIRFPNKQYFAIALRAVGYAAITYREDKEALYFRYLKGAKGVQRWNIDHLKDLSDQEFWIRKNKKELLGTSSRDSRRPVTKILVLTGQTILGKNKEQFRIENEKFKGLLIKRKTATYIVEETNICGFIRNQLKTEKTNTESLTNLPIHSPPSLQQA